MWQGDNKSILVSYCQLDAILTILKRTIPFSQTFAIRKRKWTVPQMKCVMRNNLLLLLLLLLS